MLKGSSNTPKPRVVAVLGLSVFGVFALCSPVAADEGPISTSPSSSPSSSSRFIDGGPATLADPKKAVVLIFNHGTRRPQYRHNCRPGRDVPSIVRSVAAPGKWRIYYLCSRAIDGGVTGSYTYKRAKEIEAAVDRFRARGVPAKRIFLLGHSAGGWSSLIAARQFHHKFNAVIAFAPAFAGPRYETVKYPHWRNIERPRQVAYLKAAKRIDALVIAYPDDNFNRPQELRFLTMIAGTQLVTVPMCARGHRTTYSSCLQQAMDKFIRDYIKKRLAKR